MKDCPDPQYDYHSKRYLCGCTEFDLGINHGDGDGWIETQEEAKKREAAKPHATM